MIHTMSNCFYVGTDDGEHFDMFEENLSIFEALCSYYDSINDGPIGYIQGIELGYITAQDDIEPILFHEFKL